MCPQFTVLLARTLPEWYGEHSLNRFSVPMLPNTRKSRGVQVLVAGEERAHLTGAHRGAGQEAFEA